MIGFQALAASVDQNTDTTVIAGPTEECGSNMGGPVDSD